jgi:hypothetical protein
MFQNHRELVEISAKMNQNYVSNPKIVKIPKRPSLAKFLRKQTVLTQNKFHLKKKSLSVRTPRQNKEFALNSKL